MLPLQFTNHRQNLYNTIMLNPNQVRYFLMVVECGSFRQAARQLSITQSAISASIKGLEDYLGQELFVRDKNRTILTESGKKFQGWAEKFRQDFQAMKREFRNPSSQEKPLKIGVARPQLDSIVPILEKLLESESKIPFILQSSSGQAIREELKQGNLDVAITINVGSDEEMADYPEENTHFILKDELALICAKGLSPITDPDLSQLSQKPWILTSSTRCHLEEMFEEHNLNLIVLAEVDSARIIPRLIRNTDALSLVPKQSIPPSLLPAVQFINCKDLQYQFRIQAAFQTNPLLGNPEARTRLLQILTEFKKSHYCA